MRLKSGVYLLPKPIPNPVPNPVPDRRLPEWAKGEMFPAGTYHIGTANGRSYITKVGGLVQIYDDDIRYHALAHHLLPKKEPTLRDVMAEGSSDFDAITVLVALAGSGLISEYDVRAAKMYFASLDVKRQIELFTKNGFSYQK